MNNFSNRFRYDSHLTKLATQIKSWGAELGMQAVGITATALEEDEHHLQRWLTAGYHGNMNYMSEHGSKRSRPAELIPGTVRVISVRMNYLRDDEANITAALDDTERAYISRYALGRDYHKLLRKRLQQLANKITAEVGDFGYRVFVDSAPVLEKAIARNAGLGWIGKHTLVINRDAGSWFFLGEIYTDLPLPVDPPQNREHCGSCTACLDVCPTQAIIAPYQLDARRCISYLTIENKGAIPVEFRKAIGNRIFGCDDCQLVCPWNKFAQHSTEDDFTPRHKLDHATLIELFQWTAEAFDQRTAGMPLRRAGYVGWLRNIAVALGNAPSSPAIIQALTQRADDANAVVREHVQWALKQHPERMITTI